MASRPILVFFFLAENKRYVPLWDCYLKNSATLVFTTFEISKHPTFAQCLIGNVLGPPYLVLQSFNFTILIRYLSKKQAMFYLLNCIFTCKQRPLQWFSRILSSQSHVNVQNNKLDLLKQFSVKNDSPAPYQCFSQIRSDLIPSGAAIH